MSKTPVKRSKTAGMRGRQLELKQTRLEHPVVPRVIETVIRAALDDDHKNQADAQKILMGRMLHVSTFEKAADIRENINTIRPEKESNEGEIVGQ